MGILDFLVEATKEQSKLRLAISGPSGSGKTFSGINILMHLGCERIAVLDTEHGSAAKYANEFQRKFKVIDNRYWKSNYDPRRLIAVLKELGPHVDGILVDSLTHFWMGPGGMLTLVDEFAKQASRTGGKYDTFGAWKKADPIYNELVQTILALPCHFAAGLRAKSEYEDQVVDGKKKKVKVGLAAQMRDGFEYEFDVEGLMTMDHEFIVGKTRCRALDGKTYPMPGANIAEPLLAWLTDGDSTQAVAAQVPAVEEPAPDTNRNPPTERAIPAAPQSSPLPEPQAVDVLLAKLAAAATEADLKSIANEIKRALDDNRITEEERISKLSPAYAGRRNALKAGKAA